MGKAFHRGRIKLSIEAGVGNQMGTMTYRPKGAEDPVCTAALTLRSVEGDLLNLGVRRRAGACGPAGGLTLRRLGDGGMKTSWINAAGDESTRTAEVSLHRK